MEIARTFFYRLMMRIKKFFWPHFWLKWLEAKKHVTNLCTEQMGKGGKKSGSQSPWAWTGKTGKAKGTTRPGTALGLPSHYALRRCFATISWWRWQHLRETLWCDQRRRPSLTRRPLPAAQCRQFWVAESTWKRRNHACWSKSKAHTSLWLDSTLTRVVCWKWRRQPCHSFARAPITWLSGILPGFNIARLWHLTGGYPKEILEDLAVALKVDTYCATFWHKRLSA